MGGDAEQIEELERRRSAELARAHAALAEAQDKSYWLDRWHVDLNALMQRRGASELRALVRMVRGVYRAVYNGIDRTRRTLRALPKRAADATQIVGQERGRADALAGPRSGGPSGRLSATPVSDRLTTRLDGDDPHALVALQRADVLVDALARAGGAPGGDQEWLGVGSGAEAVVELVSEAYPDVRRRREALDASVDVAFALHGWQPDERPLDRVGELRHAVKAGGRLLLSADTQSGDPPLTPARVLAECTPDWHVELYLPGGMEGSRDLYVLRRA
jgi:hypothetical protein